jgi:hypothetical protein
MLKNISKAVSYFFHPIIIPSAGFLILLNAGFYFTMLSPEARRFILLVVFFSTAVLPLISLAVLAFNPKFDLRFEKPTDRVIVQLGAAVFYYLGYFLLDKMHVSPFFKVFLISGSLLIVFLSIISLKWRISIHLSALGALLGAILALSFRLGVNPSGWISAIILVSGIVASARMLLGKSNLSQLVTGFALGMGVFYLIVYFI